MEEIKVNEYIRTSKGQIDIFKEYGYERTCVRCENKKYFTSEITKHSPNIIDLIEENDYVNGHRVRCVYLEGTRHYIKLENFDLRVYNEEIKNVVTHEQFDSIKYEVE